MLVKSVHADMHGKHHESWRAAPQPLLSTGQTAAGVDVNQEVG